MQIKRINAWFKTATRYDVNNLLSKIILSDRQKQVFEMFYLKRQNIGFIADTLGFSVFSLCMAKKALRENPDLLDHFFDSPIVASVVKTEGDEYDLDILVKTIKGVLTDDSYSIILPKILMFAPKDCIIKINAADIDKIISYIQTMPMA